MSTTAMPNRPLQPCTVAGCPALTASGRCPDHRRQYERSRGTAAQRGYDGRWQRRRRVWLAAHPLCADPDHRHPNRIRAATDVDHVVPKSQGGADDESNFQSLCHECHSAKTARESAPRRFG